MPKSDCSDSWLHVEQRDDVLRMDNPSCLPDEILRVSELPGEYGRNQLQSCRKAGG